MQALQNINLASLADSVLSLSAAFIMGGLIGLERQFRQRTAGLRTNVVVAVGAAIFVDMANRLGGSDGAVRGVAYVVAGVGFLGAGVSVRGLNTAATLWASAAVGACAGADLVVESFVGTLFVLAANTLLRPVVNRINRQPMGTASVEVSCTVYVIAPREHQKLAMSQLHPLLEQLHHPVRDLAVHAFGEHEVEIEATLSATSVDGSELDGLVAHLKNESYVQQAFWSPSTTE